MSNRKASMINPITFESLSSRVDDLQRKTLSSIWQHYLDKNQWPNTRRIHHDFGKHSVQNALKPLGGMIVREIMDGGTYRYQLLFLGLLLTDQGIDVEQLLIPYLKFLKQTFDEDPEREIIVSEHVRIFFNCSQSSISPDKLILLGKAIHLSTFLNWAGSQSSDWTARFPDDIDEWATDTNFSSYLRMRAMERYDPTVPIDDRVRELRLFGQPESSKELEQKFKILYSPGQAKQDFDKWKLELEPSRLPIAIAFVDIDLFKPLNTRYGHPQIDETILPEAQRLLADLIRNRGDAYKHGGDEFLLILPNHNSSEALALAERVRSTFEQYLFKIGEDSHKLTVSIGISLWPEDGSDYDQILQKASEMNGKAKLIRNTVIVASAKKTEATGMSSKVEEAINRKAAEESKRKALKRAKSYSVN